ncbi:outer membrane lipoprotein carrier protein LolA [bacterium]|nr:outer membrane lipoprotein carrier protein LolA [bacterium]
MRTYSYWVIVALLTMGSLDVRAQSADNLQAEIATKYESLKAMSASFVQVTTSEFMEAPERFSGTIVFSGSKYRIQTSSQTIVTDGQTLWISNRTEKQVIINDFIEDESSFSLTSLLRQIGSDYTATLLGQKKKDGVDHDLISLIPKDENVQFKSVQIDARSSDSIVTRVEVLDFNDVRMVFDLHDIVLNPVISSDSFSFVPPSGVEVIDLRN